MSNPQAASWNWPFDGASRSATPLVRSRSDVSSEPLIAERISLDGSFRPRSISLRYGVETPARSPSGLSNR